jgi:hypothetical protein
MTTKDTILGTIDPEITERLVSRRDALKKGAFTGSQVAAAVALGSVPVALAALSRRAFAQLPAGIKAVLDFALVLEIFENEFYKAVLGTSTTANNAAFLPVRNILTANFAGVVTAVQQIQKHEAAHVAFLQSVGATSTITVADLDFTGGRGSGNGPFRNATTDAAFLLAVAQLAEDTGVRAYKGQAGNLISDPAILTQALRIHSVEARHASKIRRARRAVGGGTTVVKYSGTISGGGAAAAGISGASADVTAVAEKVYGAGGDATNYPSEANTTQAGINIAGITNAGGASGASEAFDEPLSKADVIAIVQPFFIPTLS